MFFKTVIISGTFVLSVFLILDNINIANGKLLPDNVPYLSVVTHVLYRITRTACSAEVQVP
jgi:lipopolysaccharide export LptBFGC system permease protein LptF